jgi:hypothetical protein
MPRIRTGSIHAALGRLLKTRFIFMQSCFMGIEIVLSSVFRFREILASIGS